MNVNEAEKILLEHYPKMVTSTQSELDKFFVFSLRPEGSDESTTTGGVCYLVHKSNKKVEPCSIYDKRLRV